MQNLPFTKQELIDMAKDAYDQRYYKRAMALKQFMLGIYDYEKPLDEQPIKIASISDSSDIIPVYPDISLTNAATGVQNHALVASRYLIQGIVFSEPKFTFDFDNPFFAAVNDAWLKKMWSLGDWSSIFLDAGMSYEQNGVSFCKAGVTGDGRVHWRFVDIHNCIWDPYTRNPDEYQWFLVRDFLCFRDALAKYGHLFWKEGKTDEENGKAAHEGIAALCKSVSQNNTISDSNIKSLVEWEFCHEHWHCIILGNIETGPMLNFNMESGVYEYADGKDGRSKTAKTGVQPFDGINVATWWDMTVPGRRGPVGKAELTIALSSLANTIEKTLDATVRNAPMINGLSTQGMEPEQIERFQAYAREGKINPSVIGELLLFADESIKDSIIRVPGPPVDQGLLLLRNEMKGEMNASGGQSDNQRGQRVDGDRVTAKEIATINQGTSVIPGHTRKQFANFLQKLTKITRRIGSLYASWDGTIWVSYNGKPLKMDLDRYPIKPFLEVDSEVFVNPDSLETLNGEAKRSLRLEQFNMLDLTFIKLGVFDAKKVAEDVYNTCYGISNISYLLATAPPAPEGMEQMMGGQGLPEEATKAINQIQGQMPTKE
jgi:hypothetical protein